MAVPLLRRRSLLLAAATASTVALVAVPAVQGSDRRALPPAGSGLAADALADGSLVVPTLDELGDAPVPGDAMLSRTGGTVPVGAFQRAADQAAALRDQPPTGEGELLSRQWELAGPTNIGGRVLDVVVDPDDADAIMVATATGGVWRSEDAGATFEPAWPDDLTQAVGALTVTPGGTWYAATGEAGPGGGSLTYGGTGVYRSRDDGATWQYVGLGGTERFGRVVVSPADPDTVFAAAGGPLFSGGGQRGVYRSTDGGDSWQLVLPGENPTTGAADVAVDPVDPKVVYATMWDRVRFPDKRQYTGVGSGLFKSTDGGTSWRRIATGLLGPNPLLGRIGIAVAPDRRLYVQSHTEAGLDLPFLTSRDGGATFTAGTVPAGTSGGFVYAWWFGRVYVDPKNSDTVWFTGVGLGRSTNGGQSFSTVGGVHADQHGMAWDPRVPNRVYLGNDGGVYRSDNNGSNWVFGKYQPWSQFYSVDVSQQDPTRIVGGLQDNGSNRSYGSNLVTGPDRWTEYVGGDGTETRIDPKDHTIVYGCSQYGACQRRTNSGNTSGGSPSMGDRVVSARKNWLTPIEFDPADVNVVYNGGEVLNRSTDRGVTWTPISPDLSNGPGRETNPLFRNYGTITSVAPAVGSRTGTIYVGTDDGNVQYTHDGGTTWTKATGLPRDWVSRVAVDPTNRLVAYASFSAFRSGDQRALVFRTADGGRTWTDVSAGLPQAPVNDVVPAGDDLVVATDTGVYLTRDVATGGGRTWVPVGRGLPVLPMMDLRWHTATEQLFVATFGRGVYAVRLGGVVRVAAPTAAGTDAGTPLTRLSGALL